MALNGVMADLPPFDRVVVEHGPVVLRVLRATAARGAAEDCFQETFLAALRAYPRLRPGSDVRAWLVTIARRKAVDDFRARARAPATVQLPDGSPGDHLVAFDPDPADIAGLGEDLGIDDPGLRTALLRLPERLRSAVVARHLADLSYDALADLLETTPGAARRAVSDGIARLRLAIARPSVAPVAPISVTPVESVESEEPA